MKVFEAFCGIGSQSMALKNIGINFECVGVSEIDDDVYNAYSKIHGNVKNFGDITKINEKEIPDFDFFTYTFPCQDISSVGSNKGFSVDSNTKSSLLWECERIIAEKKPSFLFMENVPNVRRGKNKKNFERWQNILNKFGYNNFVFDLDSKDINFPQRRNRCFMVSTMEKKDIDIIKILNNYNKKKTVDSIIEKNISFKNEYRFIDRIDLNKLEAENLYFLDDRDWKLNGIVISKICPTQRAGRSGIKLCFIDKHKKFFFRNITPLESWKLMGFSEKDYKKISNEITKTKIFFICGNSIVVDVLECIFKEVFND